MNKKTFEVILVAVCAYIAFYVSAQFEIVGWHKYVLVGVAALSGSVAAWAFAKGIFMGVGATLVLLVISLGAFGFFLDAAKQQKMPGYRKSAKTLLPICNALLASKRNDIAVTPTPGNSKVRVYASGWDHNKGKLVQVYYVVSTTSGGRMNIECRLYENGEKYIERVWPAEQ